MIPKDSSSGRHFSSQAESCDEIEGVGYRIEIESIDGQPTTVSLWRATGEEIKRKTFTLEDIHLLVLNLTEAEMNLITRRNNG